MNPPTFMRSRNETCEYENETGKNKNVTYLKKGKNNNVT